MSGPLETAKRARRRVGVIARAALVERGHMKPTMDPWEHEGPAPQIPSEDKADLKLYFSEEQRVASEGARGSNFDAMTDRLALYSQRPRACTHCGGVREVREKVKDELGRYTGEENVLVEEKPGSGLETSSQRFSWWFNMQSQLNREGEDPNKRPPNKTEIEEWLLQNNEARERNDDGTWGRFLGYGDYFCQKCEMGWVLSSIPTGARLTVDFTGHMPKTVPKAMVGGSDALERLGRVGRKRARVRAFDPISDATCEALFSPDGESRVALWHLTPTGQHLLEDNHRRLPWQTYFLELIRVNERKEDEEDRERGTLTRYSDEQLLPEHGMKTKLKQADREANQLRTRFRRVWHKVVVCE